MRLKTYLITVIFLFLFLIFFCEFLIYYLVLIQCRWPTSVESGDPVKVMLLADTHLLGPFRGHWLDKLRREWQMHRAFQTAMTLFAPEHVFILGDVFDEGLWVNQGQFREYVSRFSKLFYTPSSTRMHALVGNHDVGFHYETHPLFVSRFYGAFNTSGVQIISIRGTHFVTLNSVAFERDGCVICEKAERELINISYQLECARGKGSAKSCEKLPKIGEFSKPIVLQHFPLYRKSDRDCLVSTLPKMARNKEAWDVLSKESTELIGHLLDPRLAFSGHTHFYCHIQNPTIDVEEFTIPSFSWRNTNDPSFLLATFTPSHYDVSKCDMPKESTVVGIYVIGILVAFLMLLFSPARMFFRYCRCYLALKEKCKTNKER